MVQEAVIAAAPSSSTKLLNELLEGSSSLPHRDSDLGSIQLGINEIRKRANRLRKIKSEKAENIGSLTKAHYLLAGKIAIETIESELKSLEQHKGLETRSKPVQNTDLDSYLRSKKNENILTAIEQSLSTAASDFDKFVSQNITLDWKQRREEIREAFGITRTKNSNVDSDKKAKTSTATTWGKSTRLLDDNTFKVNVNENYLIRGKFEHYAKIINKLNNYRQSIDTKEEFDLAKEISIIFQSGSDLKSKQFYESWQVISQLKSASSRPCNDVQVFKDRTVQKAKTHLELQFFDYIDNIYKNKVVNKGLPTIVNKVKSFIEYQKLNSNGNLLIVNGLPIWALVFYLLRAGCEEEALALVQENQQVFKKVEQSFVSYFKAYVNSKDKRLPQSLVAQIQNEFSQHIKKSVDGDPYRYAVYKILGRCQLSRRNISNIALTIEDWVWMHLMLVRDDNQDGDPIHEKYTLSDFQQIITSYGPSKFTSNYLQILLLAGLYEEAIKYALEVNEIDGVHLAIGLSYYQLLQNSSEGEDLKTRGLQFSKLLGSYIKSFKFSDPRIAVEYLILICLFKDQVETSHEALRELILETREFAILLGKINTSGVRIPGKIEQRKSLISLDNDFLHKVTEQAAFTADKEGRTYDGLLLYQLAEEYEIVITIVNKLLGEYLSNTELEQPLLDGNSETNPILIAENLLNTYQSISMKNRTICQKLLKISEVRQLFLQKNWDQTLKKIEELDILPINPNTNLSIIRLKAEELSYLDENLLRNVPNLLIVTMTSVAQSKEQIYNSVLNSSIKEEKAKELKLIAKNCVVFAGMVQYKMPRETFNLLISLEASL